MEQKALSQASGVSLPTIQRMEASNGTVRGVIESLTKVMAALEAAGIEFINEGAPSSGGGRGVRLRRRAEQPATFSDGLPSRSRGGRRAGRRHVPMVEREISFGWFRRNLTRRELRRGNSPRGRLELTI